MKATVVFSGTVGIPGVVDPCKWVKGLCLSGYAFLCCDQVRIWQAVVSSGEVVVLSHLQRYMIIVFCDVQTSFLLIRTLVGVGVVHGVPIAGLRLRLWSRHV